MEHSDVAAEVSMRRMPVALVALVVGAALFVACSDRPITGPLFGSGCTSEQESSVRLEDGMRVTQLFVTRDYTRVYLEANIARTEHYRACQAYTCSAVREDPSAPLTDEEVTAALAACREGADSAWAAGYPP